MGRLHYGAAGGTAAGHQLHTSGANLSSAAMMAASTSSEAYAPPGRTTRATHRHFGSPPSADAIWSFLSDLLAGRTPQLVPGLIHYD